MSYDYRKLRGRIREKFGTQAEFSRNIGLSEVSVSNKLNNVVDWGQDEMESAIVALDIPFSDIHSYFLLIKLSKTQLNNLDTQKEVKNDNSGFDCINSNMCRRVADSKHFLRSTYLLYRKMRIQTSG